MTLDLNKCEPMTLYTDGQGKLWRVVGYWTEPVVCMEPVEEPEGKRLYGGIRGAMWDGFTRMVPEQKPPQLIPDWLAEAMRRADFDWTPGAINYVQVPKK